MSNVYARNRTESPLEVINKSELLLIEVYALIMNEKKITKTGKVIKMLTRQNITKERRKLKKMARMVEDGTLSFKDVKISYQSWRGYASKKQAYRTIKEMDQLFDNLFINNWHS